MLHSHHAWVSFIAYAEAYNEAIRLHDTWISGGVEKWRRHWQDTLVQTFTAGKDIHRHAGAFTPSSYKFV